MFGPDSGKMANAYRMTDRDIRLMIQLRATNAAIFTGRRNSALRGWRAIRKEMGLQGMLSARQLKKKWDNLKEKYKVLKTPPEGMENLTRPSSWRWFSLMDEAMNGRLVGTAGIVQPSLRDEDEDRPAALPPLALPNAGPSVVETGPDVGDVLEPSGVEAARRRTSEPRSRPHAAVLYATLLPNCAAAAAAASTSSSVAGRNIVREAAEVDGKLAELQRERRALEREQAEFDRELIALERDRELLNRDAAALERDRASIERDRTTIERDRAALDRDRAFLDRDRAFLERDRVLVERDRVLVERDRVLVERAREDVERDRAQLRTEEEEGAAAAVDGDQAEKEVVLQTRFYQSWMAADVDPDQLETRQRLVSLFQKLVEKL
ncbi:uncharacterized protein LOC122985188 [Thunnus albacares]|uniref:uncharacterized protein LOC122985188 n=1 Tax=Thunnus albacares TaxID=8236 RepID=UPI001CF65B96|nr:uncharacterized protein LOC122985188 [Thunnus albacares]